MKEVITKSEIAGLLPHRYPMLLVDSVYKLEMNEQIVAAKNITRNEACYSHMQFNEHKHQMNYPYSLMFESFGQTACILMAKSVDEMTLSNKIMIFGSVKDVEIFGDAYPGERLEHTVRLVAFKNDTAFVEGEIRTEERLVLRIGLATLAFRPRSIL